MEHLIPKEGRPCPTAARAYSICASFPDGENVVKLALMESRESKPERVSVCHLLMGLSMAERGRSLPRDFQSDAATRNGLRPRGTTYRMTKFFYEQRAINIE